MFYTQKERLEIVLDISKKLKNFKGRNGQIVDLYNDNLCSFIPEFKKICNEYIKQNENSLVEFSGDLIFEEINKKIEYILPIEKNKLPLFVIRA